MLIGLGPGPTLSLYKHCNYLLQARDRLGAEQVADLSWIDAARNADDKLLTNMLNCGQLINNRTTKLESNVSYIEIDLPLSDIDRRLLKYIPNIMYSHNDDDETIRLCGKVFQLFFFRFF